LNIKGTPSRAGIARLINQREPAASTIARDSVSDKANPLFASINTPIKYKLTDPRTPSSDRAKVGITAKARKINGMMRKLSFKGIAIPKRYSIRKNWELNIP
jgi:hypothetical protein